MFQVNEPLDSFYWSDNYMCTDRDIGMQWSASGPIAGLDCTLLNHPEAIGVHGGWTDNHLCLPTDSLYRLTWTSTGVTAGHWQCAQWNEGDPISWDDNYMCVDPK